jgi:hypothetical protein
MVIIWYVLPFFMIFYGSFAGTVKLAKRLAGSENYFYPYQAYKFRVNEDERIRKNVPGFFEVWYGIYDYPNTKEIIEPDGKMFILRGPPFTFQMYFIDINHNISYFHFRRIYLTKDNGDEHDLLKSENMYFNTRFTHGYYYDIEEDDVEIFKQTKEISIAGLIAFGRAELEKNIENWAPDRTRNKEQMLGDGLISIKIGVEDLPIEIKTDENLILGFDFDVTMNDGEIHNFVFEDIYKKEYEEIERMHSFNSPEKFGKDK